MAQLIHELVERVAARAPSSTALRHGAGRVSYAGLAAAMSAVAAALAGGGAGRDDRVACCLLACPESVALLLGAASAGCAFVPLDPQLAPDRLCAQLRHSGARVLVAGAAQAAALAIGLADCPALRSLVVLGEAPAGTGARKPGPRHFGPRAVAWDDWLAGAGRAAPAAMPVLGALLYDPRSAEPVASALSQRNLVAGAASSARCVGLGAGDRILAALPLHSDYGLNAVLATLSAGATAWLGAPGDSAAPAALLERGELTGLWAAPAAWEALAGASFGRGADCLRFLVSAGGSPERGALDALRRALPRTRIHLMYDVGDACRSTCLMPSQLDERPGSIGRAMPYSDWLVLRADGRECAPGETGELVQRGPLVTLGYWNDPGRSGAEFRQLPPLPGLALALAENGRWPGAGARKDMDGYLYLVDARSDTITTGGYRVRAREVEKIVVGTGLVAEAAAVGVAHPVLGQVIAVLATARPGVRLDSAILFGACRARLPQHMLPAMVDVRRAPLPRARDGQIDRALLAGELAPLFAEAAP